MKGMTGLLVALAVAGCGTIYEARKAQSEVAPKGVGVAGGAGRVNLRGSTLEQLVGFAMTNRPTVVSAALAVEDARLAMRELAADAPVVSTTPWLSPKISAGGGYAASSAPAKLSDLEWKTEGNASASLSLDLLIWDFGRHSAQMDAAAENVIAAEAELASAGYQVFEDVASAYFNLLGADALLEVALTNENEYALHEQYAEERLRSGEAQRLDVTRAKLDLSQARQATVLASNTVSTCAAELMKALGIDAAHGTRDDVLLPMPDSISAVMQGFGETKYDVAWAFELARTNTPFMAERRARLRAASARVDAAVANLYPSVSASVSLSWADPLWAWSWGVNAVQTIFQGFRKTTAVDRAVNAMKSAASAVDEAEQQLSLQLELAVTARDDALKARETAWHSVLAARENLDTVKAQYAEGYASRVDFTDAVGDFASAAGSCIKAYYGGQIAEAKLFALIGRMPEFRERKISERKMLK